MVGQIKVASERSAPPRTRHPGGLAGAGVHSSAPVFFCAVLRGRLRPPAGEQRSPGNDSTVNQSRALTNNRCGDAPQNRNNGIRPDETVAVKCQQFLDVSDFWHRAMKSSLKFGPNVGEFCTMSKMLLQSTQQFTKSPRAESKDFWIKCWDPRQMFQKSVWRAKHVCQPCQPCQPRKADHVDRSPIGG